MKLNIITDATCPQDTIYLVPTQWAEGDEVELVLDGNELKRMDWEKVEGEGENALWERKPRPLTDVEKQLFGMITNLGG